MAAFPLTDQSWQDLCCPWGSESHGALGVRSGEGLGRAGESETNHLLYWQFSQAGSPAPRLPSCPRRCQAALIKSNR